MSRRFLQSLAKENILPQNILSFPKNLLIPNWDSSINVFRLMVDASNGDDSNDGLTWATAKKTIQSALDFLPNDLQGYKAFILVKSGTYPPFKADKINGYIYFIWCGSVFNGSSHSKHIWYRAGSVNPFADNGQIIVRSDVTQVPIHCTGKNITYEFCSFDDNYTPWSAGYGYAVRWVVDCNNSGVGSCYLGDGVNVTVWFFSLQVNLNLAMWYGLEIHNKTALTNVACYGGSGSASSGTGQWRGAISGGSRDSSMAQIGGGYGFASGYTMPGGTYLYFEDVAQVYGSQSDSADALDWSDFTLKYVKNTSAFTNTNIWLGANFKGHIKYDSTNMTLQDNSIVSHLVTDVNTGITKNYITKDLVDDGTNISYKGTNISVP